MSRLAKWIAAISLGLLLSFGLTTVVMAQSAPAKKKPTGSIPTSFKSEGACNTRVSQYELSAIKEYSEKRSQNRTKSLDAQTKKIDKTYGPNSSQHKAYTSLIEKQNKLLRKHVGNAAPQATPKSIEDISHKDELLAAVGTARTQINNQNNAVKSASTPQAAASAICSMIYDVRVYTYLDEKLKHQIRLDGLAYKQASNEVRLQTGLTLYTSFKSKAPNNPKLLELEKQAQAAGIPSTQDTDSRLSSLQAKLDTVNPDFLNSQISSGARIKSSEYFGVALIDYPAAQKQISLQTSAYNRATSALTGIKL